jgi:hypothetical protein
MISDPEIHRGGRGEEEGERNREKKKIDRIKKLFPIQAAARTSGTFYPFS